MKRNALIVKSVNKLLIYACQCPM